MASNLSNEELSQRMRNLVFGGHIGPAEGKAITSDIVREDSTSIVFIAALISLSDLSVPLDRYLLCLTKQDGALLSTTPVSLNDKEMAGVLRNAGCGELVQYDRMSDGVFGTTYKAKAYMADGETTDEYVVQLRYHANIDSMYHLIQYIRDKNLRELPVPRMFPTAVEATSSSKSDLGIQISQFVPGKLGSDIYASLSREGKMSVIRQLARTLANLWDLPVPGAAKLIGEAIVSSDGNVTVGPERRHRLGGPFTSVKSFLQAWIKHRVTKLQDQVAIDEFKERYLSRILQFVESSLDDIPADVEDVKLSLVHTDLSIHNMIFSESSMPVLHGVIDWELVDHAPAFITIPTLLEPTFEVAKSDEWPTAPEELRKAFWDEIPTWKHTIGTKGSQAFLDLYSFGYYLKADGLPDRNADLAAKERHWEKNAAFVTRFLEKWGEQKASN